MPKEFFDKAQHIRNQCLKWRFDHLDKIDYEATLKLDFGSIEPRLQQISLCIAALFTDNEKLLEEFKEWLKAQQLALIEEREATSACRDYREVVKWLETHETGFTASDIALELINQLPPKEAEKARLKSWATVVGKNLKTMGFTSTLERKEGETKKRRFYHFDQGHPDAKGNTEALIRNASRYIVPEDKLWDFINKNKMQLSLWES